MAPVTETGERELVVNLLEIEHAPIDLMEGLERNVKDHTPEQIEMIASAIRKFGFADPIAVVTQPDGKLGIVEGHGRVEAAKSMGLTEIPVVRLDHLSDEERRAYAIAHNQTQMMTGLDLDEVSYEFDRLGIRTDEHFAVGFTPEDMIFLEPQAETSVAGTDHNGHQSGQIDNHLPPVVRTRLRFAEQEDLETWHSFIETLRSVYPEGITIAERLMMFLDDFERKFEDSQALAQRDDAAESEVQIFDL